MEILYLYLLNSVTLLHWRLLFDGFLICVLQLAVIIVIIIAIVDCINRRLLVRIGVIIFIDRIPCVHRIRCGRAHCCRFGRLLLDIVLVADRWRLCRCCRGRCRCGFGSCASRAGGRARFERRWSQDCCWWKRDQKMFALVNVQSIVAVVVNVYG